MSCAMPNELSMEKDMSLLEKVISAVKPSAADDGVDALDLLKKDHDDVEALFKDYEMLADGDGDSGDRRALSTRICGMLAIHALIEEEIFYPAVRELGTKKAEDMIGEAYEEHHVVKLVLAEIPKVDPADDAFEYKMTVLKELVEHHVEEEEDEMFPMAEKKLGDRRSSELAQQMAGPKAA